MKRKKERFKCYRRTKRYYIMVHSSEHNIKLKNPIAAEEKKRNYQSCGTDFFIREKRRRCKCLTG